MSNSPIKNVTSRYLKSLDNESTLPLQPTLKYNSPSKPMKQIDNPDLDILAKQLTTTTIPSKTALLREKFESPSVTVSSFKTPSSISPFSSIGSSTSPTKRNSLETESTPSWANKNYKDNLKTPSKQAKTPSITLKPLNDPISTSKETTRLSSPIFTSPSNNTSRDSPGYEYLCRIQAIKTWLIEVLQEDIPQTPVELITYIRNGIYLAKLANVILPSKRNVFLNEKLQFKHTENINRFFALLDYLNVPDLFRFELTDLYDGKNIPKVWFCIHALSYILNISNSNYPKIVSVVDKLEFESEDIRLANRALIGAPLPNFDSADNGKEEESVKLPPKVIQEVPRIVPQVEFKKLSPKAVLVDPFREEDIDISVEETESLFIEPLKASLPEPEPVSIPEPISQPKNAQYYTPKLSQHSINIIKFQSLSRGAIFRYHMFVKKILLKSYSDEFTQLFSIIRGNQYRSKTIHKHRNVLRGYTSEITGLQSIIRRDFIIKKKPDLNTNRIVKFQSEIRGKLVRNRVDDIRKVLECEKDKILTLQCSIRAKTIHQTTSKLLEINRSMLSRIVELQSASRRLLCTRKSHNIDSNPIITIQSIIRRNLLINNINTNHATIRSNKRNIIELQSIARGAITRTRLCNNVLISLLFEDDNLNDLFGIVRGNNLRKQIRGKKQELQKYGYSTIRVQSLFRGILCRFTKEITLDDVYEQVDSVIHLQSLIRGHKIRNEITSLKRYYEKNVDLVIKSQSILRRTFVQNAYQALITSKNPSLGVIRKFAHLLSNNDLDYEEEMELSQAKDIIIEKSKRNEEIENQIDHLDIKLKLLDKNKITIEEFIKPSKNKPVTNAVNVKDLPRMNKNSRMRIELYQTLFYLLQTRPNYLSKLYQGVTYQEKDTKFLKDLFGYIVQLFPMHGTKSREEFFYMKWIITLMEQDMNQAKNISDITKSQSAFWIDYFLQFNNSTIQRQALKLIMGKFVLKLVDNDQLDFESDPSLIHNSIVEHEIKVHGTSTREKNITPQSAIKLPDVSSRFVENLISLRETTTTLLTLLELTIVKIPIHIKIICNQAYKLSQSQFPDRTDQQHLSVAGVILFKHYIASILHIPENYGITTNDPFNPKINNIKSKSNLFYLSRVMLQLFSMKPFSDNFLKPLNDYIISTTDTVRNLIMQVINVKDIELEYGLNEYEDIVISQRPELTMKINTMISLEKLVSSNIDLVAPGSDDQLVTVINELDDIVNSSQDLMFLTDLGALTLNLNPATNEESMSDVKARTLFTQVKRCILYIIRIQSGDELLELLISGIQPEDELKFKQIVYAEREEAELSDVNAKKKPYYRSSLGDLTRITYHDLKKMALGNILELESMGELTRRNSFQEILNQIAVDIKTKDIQRERRRQQLEITKATAQKLTDKERFLSKQLNDYNDHIDNVLAQLTTKPKDKKIFNIIPVFSKQYFYHRELRKRNRLPKFGSYKYSSKRLIEQKVLLDIAGLINRHYMKSSKLDFLFSCHEIGKFTIEAANGSVAIPGASAVLTLDEILTLQIENMNKIEMFDGMAIFNCSNLTALLFKKFYDIRE